jgi:hypothetical protein
VPTRVILNGQTRYATHDWRPTASDRLGRVRSPEPAESIITDVDPNTGVRDAPPPRRRPEPGTLVTAEDGATYRVLKKLNDADGWVPAGVVMAWYGVPHVQVIAWLRRGLLDGAIEAGSPTYRYRVVDAAGCRRECNAALAMKPPAKRGRAKP